MPGVTIIPPRPTLANFPRIIMYKVVEVVELVVAGGCQWFSRFSRFSRGGPPLKIRLNINEVSLPTASPNVSLHRLLFVPHSSSHPQLAFAPRSFTTLNGLSPLTKQVLVNVQRGKILRPIQLTSQNSTTKKKRHKTHLTNNSCT